MAITLSAYVVLTLEEAQSAIKAGTNFDEISDLTLYINAVTDLVEGIIGDGILARQYSETFDGDGKDRHRVIHTPVLSGGSYTYTVTIDGVAIPAANISVNLTQGIFRLESYAFTNDFQNCVIAYYAGRATVPDSIKLAASQIIARFWKLRDKSMEVVSSVTSGGETVSFRLDAVPPEAKALLAKYRKPRFA